MLAPNFWDDQDKSSSVINELNSLKSVVKDITVLNNQVNDLDALLQDSIDDETMGLVEEEYSSVSSELEKLELLLLLNEEYDNWYDSPIGKAYENIWEGQVLEEFLDDKRNGIKEKQWDLIPAAQYQNLLRRYMEMGENARIPDRIVDEWIQLIANNLVTLEYMTAFAGHASYFPEDAFEDVFGEQFKGKIDYDNVSVFLENIGYYDWAQLPDGSDAISDYGIKPIADILSELSPDSTPEDKLIIINRCLDVIHCRGDLASAFIQGGRSTCSRISGQNR